MNEKFKNLVLTLLFPIFVILVQVLDNIVIYIVLIFLIISIAITKRFKRELSLYITMTCGYLLWQYLELYLDFIFRKNLFSEEWIIALSRFSLLGYIFPFVIWQFICKTDTNYFNFGCFREKIKMPFIWCGIEENVTKVCVIFSLLCMILASIFTLVNMVSFHILIAGITFAIINSILEELLWRGFILSRIVDLDSEKMGLLVMSIAFGFYHYSLGFSIPICLVFSLGGVYFGGITISSKGLILPIVMHTSMNMLFVSIGIIF